MMTRWTKTFRKREMRTRIFNPHALDESLLKMSATNAPMMRNIAPIILKANFWRM